MSTDHGVASATTDPADAHAPTAGHGGAHGHDDERAAEPLGPVDLAGWAFALGGAAIGLITALAMAAAVHL